MKPGELEKEDNAAISGITVYSMENSLIRNCFVTGNIVQESVGTGMVACSGIVAFSKGIIESSYNSANLYGKVNNASAGCYMSGIVIGQEKNYIKNCYNSGKINLSFNNIETTVLKIAVGGIIGDTETGDTVIRNSYNAGNITNENSNDKFYIGAIFGYDRNNVVINNCYYLKSITYNGVGKEASSAEKINITQVDEDQKQEMLVKLNENNIWKSDDKNINNGYPILSWQ